MAVMKEVQTSSAAVVVVPLPAQGHLNQLLHLSRHLAMRGIPVHYATSSAHSRQVRERIQGWEWDGAAAMIYFHDLPLPPFPTLPPTPHPTTNFPSHLQPLFDAALSGMQQPLSSLLRCLAASHRRIAVIHDSAMHFVAGVAAAAATPANIEAFSFHSVSAFTTLFYQRQLLQGKDMPIEGLSLPDLSFDGCFTDEFLEFLRRQRRMTDAPTGHLINTCRAIEGRFIDLVVQEYWRDGKTFTIGPLNPVAPLMIKQPAPARHQCMEWLDRQAASSVIYVSFGTMSTLREEQIRELALGLEASGQRFVWALRDADRADIYTTGGGGPREDHLPVDYEDRLEERGMVVRGWAPQLEILAHAATGGFLSHCGWNSCMESMGMGVPILTWPMHSDQPRNAMLVTEVLRVGMVGRDWSRRHEVMPAAEIKKAVVRMMAGKEGAAARKKAVALRDAIRQEGASLEGMDAFVSHILQPDPPSCTHTG